MTYYYDAFGRLIQVDELDESNNPDNPYATTTYSYDTLGNLEEVVDAKNNVTEMTYDWLSRKKTMTDPDMGNWTYTYDANGNLETQTDAKEQTITFSYDELNRLTGKTYPAGSDMVFQIRLKVFSGLAWLIFAAMKADRNMTVMELSMVWVRKSL